MSKQRPSCCLDPGGVGLRQKDRALGSWLRGQSRRPLALPCPVSLALSVTGTFVAELQSGQREKWGILSAPSQLGWWLASQEGGWGDRGRCQQDAEGAGGGSGGLRVINGPPECPVPGQPPSAAALAASHAPGEALWCWLRLTTPGGGGSIHHVPPRTPPLHVPAQASVSSAEWWGWSTAGLWGVGTFGAGAHES